MQKKNDCLTKGFELLIDKTTGRIVVHFDKKLGHIVSKALTQYHDERSDTRVTVIHALGHQCRSATDQLFNNDTPASEMFDFDEFNMEVLLPEEIE